MSLDTETWLGDRAEKLHVQMAQLGEGSLQHRLVEELLTDGALVTKGMTQRWWRRLLGCPRPVTQQLVIITTPNGTVPSGHLRSALVLDCDQITTSMVAAAMEVASLSSVSFSDLQEVSFNKQRCLRLIITTGLA